MTDPDTHARASSSRHADVPDYHDGFASIYDDIRGDVTCVRDDVDVLLRSLNLAASSKILDWGCGTGAHARTLGELGYCVSGVDVSRAMLAEAHTRSGLHSIGHSFFCGDIASFAASDRSLAFDAFYSLGNVLNCLADRAAMLGALQVVSKMLRAGALAFVDVWNIAPLLLAGTRDVVREFTGPSGHFVQAMSAKLDRELQVLEIQYRIFRRPTDQSAWTLIRSTHRLCALTLRQYENLFLEAGFEIVRTLLQRPRDDGRSANPDDRLVSFLLRRRG